MQPAIMTSPAPNRGRQQDGQHREDQVDQTNEDRLHEGGVGADAGLFEDHRRIEKDRVDAGDLLQDGHGNSDRQNQLHGRLE
jgi:hypothetical protein